MNYQDFLAEPGPDGFPSLAELMPEEKLHGSTNYMKWHNQLKFKLRFHNDAWFKYLQEVPFSDDEMTRKVDKYLKAVLRNCVNESIVRNFLKPADSAPVQFSVLRDKFGTLSVWQAIDAHQFIQRDILLMPLKLREYITYFEDYREKMSSLDRETRQSTEFLALLRASGVSQTTIDTAVSQYYLEYGKGNYGKGPIVFADLIGILYDIIGLDTILPGRTPSELSDTRRPPFCKKCKRRGHHANECRGRRPRRIGDVHNHQFGRKLNV